MKRVRQLLARPLVIVIAAVLALALTLPSITNGLEIDDHLYRARVLDEHWSKGKSALELFVFVRADDPAQRNAQIDSGELSWWAAPKLKWGFMRPLPAVVHYAEWHAFGRGGM